MIRLSRSTAMNLVYVVLALFLDDELFIQEQSPQSVGRHADRIHGLVWNFCDVLVRSIARVKPLKQRESHLFCIAQHRYLGRPFSVDGIRVHRFDPVIEIHMNNKMLNRAIREQRSVVSLATRLIKEANRSLPALAACAASHKYRNAKVLYGTTFIHRGVERFGFSTYPIQNQGTHHFVAWYLRNIFRMTNPDARSLLGYRPQMFSPKIVAISKHRLIQAYGSRCDEEQQTLPVAEVSSH